jgi:hypothetical protein
MRAMMLMRATTAALGDLRDGRIEGAVVLVP